MHALMGTDNLAIGTNPSVYMTFVVYGHSQLTMNPLTINIFSHRHQRVSCYHDNAHLSLACCWSIVMHRHEQEEDDAR